MAGFARAAALKTAKTITSAFRGDTPRSTARRSTKIAFCPDDNDPFKSAVDKIVSQHLKPESTSTLEEKIEGVETMGHLSWTGGIEVAEYTGRKYLFLLVSLMSDRTTPDSLKLQIVKSVSEICYGLKQNQELARELSLLSVIIEYAESTVHAETRKWCLHALFFILCNNPDNQKRAIAHPKFKVCIAKGLTDNWSGWDHNEAAELNVITEVMKDF